MIDTSCSRDPVELLADEFAARCRKGELPSIVEYTARYPQHARQIEALFPAVAMMEQLRVDETGRRQRLVRHARSFIAPDRIGDFEIIQEIGRGGMGIVYEAEQRSLGRRVALKILPPHADLADGHLKRFQCEVRTAAKLRHTGIVPVFGVGEQDGLHYYVMPLVRGVSLDEVIRELRAAESAANGNPTASDGGSAVRQDIEGVVKSLISQKFPAPGPAGNDVPPTAGWEGAATKPWITAARLGVQAAEALEYAHAQGTLHRDIKPGNLLVDEQGNACLADLGLARVLEPTDPRLGAEIVGTPRYMAPEQFQGIADARSDIYGLGLTLHELLTLQSPDRDHGARRASDDRRLPTGPSSPRSLNKAIPRDLDAILRKCLTREPARRYRTASALAADLRHFLEGKPIQARPISRLERGWRWCRRNPALAAVSALAAMLVFAFVATAVTGHIQTRKAYTETRRALARADATSGVALEVLEGIYLQLAPERLWIPSDSDSIGQACACMGLRSTRPADPGQLNYIQVEASDQTAALLGNLLVFYDRLAEQVSDDEQVLLQSAIASRRAGDIRQRLGQMKRAETEYRKAVEKLDALRGVTGADSRVCVELARVHNEIGNVRAAQLDPDAAYRAHGDALSVLRSMAGTDQPPEEHRYELARTYYFLSSRYAGDSASDDGRRVNAFPERSVRSPFAGDQYRKQATDLLEQLVREYPDAADYRFLLALCYRPRGIVSEPQQGSGNSRGRERSLKILEALKTEYPQVVDYRYELAATYAWLQVGLFPWQGRATTLSTAERELRQALAEAQWLVDHNPTIPRYTRCKALVLAKLAAVSSESDRLAEAADLYEQALQTQEALVKEFPDLPDHDRVLREFFRLRLAAAYHRNDALEGRKGRSPARKLLEACVHNLTELAARSNLTEDRLASISLNIAEDAYRRMPTE